jgi:hypothetical protein
MADAAMWLVSNKYHAAAACENCQGIVRHEPWCITKNPNVEYAFLVIIEPMVMLEADHIILHGMGVRWNACKGKCAA